MMKTGEKNYVENVLKEKKRCENGSKCNEKISKEWEELMWQW